MHARSTPADAGPIPPLLVHLIQSANRAFPPGYGDALAAFATLALVNMPLDNAAPIGVGAEGQLYHRVRDIAARHLGLGEAERRRNQAISRVVHRSTRNEIDMAIAKLLTVHGTAHLFCGLSLGITMAEFSCGGVR